MAVKDKQPTVATWVEQMKPIVEALNAPDLDTRTKYVEGLTAQIEALREFVGEEEPPVAVEAAKAAPAAPAAGADPLAAPPANAVPAPNAVDPPPAAGPAGKAPAAPKLPIEDELG